MGFQTEKPYIFGQSNREIGFRHTDLVTVIVVHLVSILCFKILDKNIHWLLHTNWQIIFMRSNDVERDLRISRSKMKGQQ